MAMFPYDPYHERSLWPSHVYHHRHHGGWLTPMLATPRGFEAVLDDQLDSAVKAQVGLGQMNLTTEGGFHWRCSVAGYRPEELSVDLDGNQLVVSGEHTEQNDNESVKRTFQRRVVLPQGVTPDLLHCSVDDSGVFEVEARRPQVEGQTTHSIRVVMKPTEEKPHKEGLISKIKHKLSAGPGDEEKKKEATRA